jgi:transposase
MRWEKRIRVVCGAKITLQAVTRAKEEAAQAIAEAETLRAQVEECKRNLEAMAAELQPTTEEVPTCSRVLRLCLTRRTLIDTAEEAACGLAKRNRGGVCHHQTDSRAKVAAS